MHAIALPSGVTAARIKGADAVHLWHPSTDGWRRYSFCSRHRAESTLQTVDGLPTCLSCVKELERTSGNGKVAAPANGAAERDLPVTIRPGLTARFYVQDNRRPWPVPAESVHLVFGSPVYYGAEHRIRYVPEVPVAGSLEEWELDLAAVLRHASKALVEGGRVVLNVANSGRKPYVDLAGRVGRLMEEAGLTVRGHVIWDKGRGIAGTAWGSWKMASAPVIRDHHEYLVVGQKGDRLDVRGFEKRTDWREGEFEASTLSVWPIPPESKSAHPAPFPLALALRVVRLYTQPCMTVLDPWMGSGTSALAALQAGCNAVGLDVSRDYLKFANERIAARVAEWSAREAVAA